MSLKKTALFELHKSLKARMAPFAGYDMPIQYAQGIMKEHHHVRAKAGLFDVSHMGQVTIAGSNALALMEKLTPCDIQALQPGQAKLSMFLNPNGGIEDDCIITRYADHIGLVINAGCKDRIVPYLEQQAKQAGSVNVTVHDAALVALQGPTAAAVLEPLVPQVKTLPFMSGIRGASCKPLGKAVDVTRCGYTGEDGFEISIPNAQAMAFTELLLKSSDVQMIGLGARDTLRLEAGLNLYGHEINDTTNPVAAKLMWCISKRRMTEGGFIGHDKVVDFQKNAKTLVPRLRVGLTVESGPIARENAPIYAPDGTTEIGKVTSGAPSPTLGTNIAMAYVDRAFAAEGAKVVVGVRATKLGGTVCKVPFVPHRYFKSA